MLFKKIRVRSHEVGLKLRDGEFVGLLAAGKHFVFPRFGKYHVEVVSKRDPWIFHEQLDVIVKSGALADAAEVVDLRDHQRALVWIDGRFSRVLGPGLYAFWTGVRDVCVETVTIENARLEHSQLASIVRGGDAVRFLDVCKIDRDHVGVLFLDGRYVDQLDPGLYAFWKGAGDARVVEIDTRESQVDVSGQEMLTADKVSLRINAMVTYIVHDARRAVSSSDDVRQSIYRETQLALRSAVGGRDLDRFLSGKDDLVEELEQSVRQRASVLGLEVVSVGIRDVILPGDMKDLMNKVTEAKKAAEANLIARREETAAMRSQANTAKLLADNPTLMRLRELEVLEKIASTGNMSIVLGEKGLADRVVNLL
ncbi:slipin family protein [Allorhodopirellula solitaria]|uniref:FtsH protease regulator HflK n=1 Tax=Allorhodopirellula solitaria TaxID=2527987 RepID=A0A5C5XSI3_9BACT|nr:slipin family protein [Allorhodopirellula solitaria]TWT66216.1 FtsH protease regulator HflK [Allorhodopirellula solitaria]